MSMARVPVVGLLVTTLAIFLPSPGVGQRALRITRDGILRTSLADGTAVRIEWEIDTAARARWAARERAFFGSIRCARAASP